MALFDILVIVIVVLAGIRGFLRGLVIELFTLVAFFLGLFVALKLSFPVAARFFGDQDAFWAIAVVTFFILFFLVVWLAKVIAKSIKKVIDFTPAGIIDNLLGVVLSIVKWIFILSVIIWVSHSVDMELPRKWTKDADLYETVAMLAPAITETIGAVIPWIYDIYENMEDVPVKI